MIETQFLISTSVTLLVNLVYTLLALVLAIVGLKIIDRKMFTNIDFEAEIKKGNLAASLFASTILIFTAIIVAYGLKG